MDKKLEDLCDVESLAVDDLAKVAVPVLTQRANLLFMINK